MPAKRKRSSTAVKPSQKASKAKRSRQAAAERKAATDAERVAVLQQTVNSTPFGFSKLRKIFDDLKLFTYGKTEYTVTGLSDLVIAYSAHEVIHTVADIGESVIRPYLDTQCTVYDKQLSSEAVQKLRVLWSTVPDTWDAFTDVMKPCIESLSSIQFPLRQWPGLFDNRRCMTLKCTELVYEFMPLASCISRLMASFESNTAQYVDEWLRLLFDNETDPPNVNPVDLITLEVTKTQPTLKNIACYWTLFASYDDVDIARFHGRFSRLATACRDLWLQFPAEVSKMALESKNHWLLQDAADPTLHCTPFQLPAMQFVLDEKDIPCKWNKDDPYLFGYLASDAEPEFSPGVFTFLTQAACDKFINEWTRSRGDPFLLRWCTVGAPLSVLLMSED